MEHVPSGFKVGRIIICLKKIVKYHLDSMSGIPFGALHQRISYIGFNCVSQGIHTCCGSQMLRETDGYLGIKNCVSGDEWEITYLIFVPGLSVRNYGGNGYLTSCAGRGGDSYDKRKFFQYFKKETLFPCTR